MGLSVLKWMVPDFSTVSRRGKTLAVAVPARPTSGVSHLLIDSTGNKLRGDGEGHRRKHGRDRSRRWLKVYLAVDADSVQGRAIEVTDADVGDSPMLPHLLGQFPPGEMLPQVTADSAYETRPCHAAIAARGAVALIPPRRNGQPWSDDAPGVRRATRPCAPASAWDGRLGAPGAATMFAAGRRRRWPASNASMSGSWLGSSTAKFAELQVPAATLNRFTALGTIVTQPVRI